MSVTADTIPETASDKPLPPDPVGTPKVESAQPPPQETEEAPVNVVTPSEADPPPAPVGESLIAPTVEPPAHESTRVEVTQLKDPEVKDFGWNSKPDAVPSPLVYGLSNEDLYALIRRFNKVRRARSGPVDLVDMLVSDSNSFM